MDLSVADGFLHIIKIFLALDVFITQIIGIYIDVFISQRNDIFGWIKEKGGSSGCCTFIFNMNIRRSELYCDGYFSLTKTDGQKHHQK